MNFESEAEVKTIDDVEPKTAEEKEFFDRAMISALAGRAGEMYGYTLTMQDRYATEWLGAVSALRLAKMALYLRRNWSALEPKERTVMV